MELIGFIVGLLTLLVVSIPFIAGVAASYQALVSKRFTNGILPHDHMHDTNSICALLVLRMMGKVSYDKTTNTYLLKDWKNNGS